MSHIRNRAAYDAAIKSNIKRNATKTRRKNWFSKHEDAQRLYDWLNVTGEFLDNSELTDDIYAGSFGGLLFDIRNALSEWGAVSDKQTELIRNALARREKWETEKAENIAKRQLADKDCVWVGEIGERGKFRLHVKNVLSFETRFGVMYVNIARDDDNQIIIYKGSKRFEKGTTIELVATIKEHAVYKETKQTVISRPTKITKMN